MSQDESRGRSEEGFLGKGVPEVFRKMLIASVGAVFMTEEGIRSLVRELKLPKELLASLLAQADRTKGDVVRVMAQELRAFLESAKVREDLVALLDQLTFEVKAEIKVRPRTQGGRLLEPDIRTTVVPRRRRRKRA